MSAASDHRVFHLLQITAHRLKKHIDRQALSHAGITAAQAAILYVVSENPFTSQRFVAEELGQKESAITPMVHRLVEAGVLQRGASTADGRAWSLKLTAQGKLALKRFGEGLNEYNKALTSVLGGDTRVAEFARSLNALFQAECFSDEIKQ